MKQLIDNIHKVHTTELGVVRIKRNLAIDTNDVVEYCKNLILSKNSEITKRGKNYYISIDNCIITVNAKSFTIITAHINKRSKP